MTVKNYQIQISSYLNFYGSRPHLKTELSPDGSDGEMLIKRPKTKVWEEQITDKGWRDIQRPNPRKALPHLWLNGREEETVLKARRGAEAAGGAAYQELTRRGVRLLQEGSKEKDPYLFPSTHRVLSVPPLAANGRQLERMPRKCCP